MLDEKAHISVLNTLPATVYGNYFPPFMWGAHWTLYPWASYFSNLSVGFFISAKSENEIYLAELLREL